jgi:hypothetical protein
MIEPVERFCTVYFDLVASFANRPNLLKYEQKTHICAASTSLGRAGKTYGDHAQAVSCSVAAYHAIC